MAREKIRPPPSSVTGEVGNWLMDVWRVLNNTPNMSYFSGITPNSTVTGIAGDIAINVASASTDTRVWVKNGSTSVPSQTNWVTLHIGPA